MIFRDFFNKFFFIKPLNNSFGKGSNSLNYRENVCVIVKNRYNKFLVVNDRSGCWGFVQGGVDVPHETKVDTAFRELNEETGLSKRDLSFVGLSKIKHRYRWPYKYDGYSGQKQSFCLMKLKGNKSVVISDEELDNFLWVGFDELPIFLKHSLRGHNKVVPKIVKEFPDFFKEK